MNALLPRPEQVGANGQASWRVAATDSCPVSFSSGVVKRFNHARSHARHSGRNFLEIEVDDRLKCDGGWRISKPIRQGIEPSCVVGLKAEQLGDGIHPALKP